MKTYIQFKDDIAFAYIITDSEIDSLMVLDDSINPDSIINKKFENNKWVTPKKIRYIDQLSESGNRILDIKETIFPSEVDGEIIPDSVKRLYVKYNGQWVDEDLVKKETNPNNYASWTWDSENLVWHKPKPMPEEGGPWEWNESILDWEEIVL